MSGDADGVAERFGSGRDDAPEHVRRRCEGTLFDLRDGELAQPRRRVGERCEDEGIALVAARSGEHACEGDAANRGGGVGAGLGAERQAMFDIERTDDVERDRPPPLGSTVTDMITTSAEVTASRNRRKRASSSAA